MSSDSVRKSHYRNFMKLPPVERLRWALETGWSLDQLLTPEKKAIREKFRNGGKWIRARRMAGNLDAPRNGEKR